MEILIKRRKKDFIYAVTIGDVECRAPPEECMFKVPADMTLSEVMEKTVNKETAIIYKIVEKEYFYGN